MENVVRAGNNNYIGLTSNGRSEKWKWNDDIRSDARAAIQMKCEEMGALLEVELTSKLSGFFGYEWNNHLCCVNAIIYWPKLWPHAKQNKTKQRITENSTFDSRARVSQHFSVLFQLIFSLFWRSGVLGRIKDIYPWGIQESMWFWSAPFFALKTTRQFFQL